MTAYWVSVYKEMRDEQKMAAYSALAGPALKAAGGRILARGLPAQTYEAGINQRTVIFEFDSVEAAKAWYESDEYQAAIPLRQKAAETNVVILPGFG